MAGVYRKKSRHPASGDFPDGGGGTAAALNTAAAVPFKFSKNARQALPVYTSPETLLPSGRTLDHKSWTLTIYEHDFR